ncbi:hypothetical protein BM590_A0173 [Brucella melitensis M5-90]|nr:hypothetical protein BM590_A0173 [Brucella melitensis M5-90]
MIAGFMAIPIVNLLTPLFCRHDDGASAQGHLETSDKNL